MNSSGSFYWHDYETFGSNPVCDRPAQFAGLRTDTDLNEIGKPLVLYSRPANDFLPNPEACLVTGLTPQKALEKGIPECEFIAKINEQFSIPGTCGVGFNSIRFDDEITRFTLYRNFFDAYSREWRNGNSRWDIIDLFRTSEALRPEGIQWPTREDGYTSFRLEDLTQANGISHLGAHDALSDVKATIELARLMREKQPRLFDYALSLRSKSCVSKLINIEQQTPVLFISGIFGAKRHNSALISPLWINEARQSEVLCFDLSMDPYDLINMDKNILLDKFYSRNRVPDKGVESLGLRKIYLNRCPMIVNSGILDSKSSVRLGIDIERNLKTASVLKSWRDNDLAQFKEKFRFIFQEKKFEPQSDPDKMLYSGGFFCDGDKISMQRIHEMSPSELSSANFTFIDKRLDEMFKRYRARNYPETLSEKERSEWEDFRRKRIMDPGKGGSISLSEFQKLLEEKIAAGNVSADHWEIIAELQQYADTLLG